MRAQNLPLPTFLIIGAQKSATRWLRVNLGRHPEIYAADHELNFFHSTERCRKLGAEWYRGQFTGWTGERIVGESTPAYMMFRHHPDVVAKRIKKTVPSVRLLAVLRNPVDRAQSAWLHHVLRGRIAADVDLLTYIRAIAPGKDRLGLVAGGWYAESLGPYRALFGDQLLVLLYDDVALDPGRVYGDALTHVGATRGFVPPRLHAVQFSNRDKVDASREQGGLQEKPLTAAEREELFELFRGDVARLELMLGRDLSAWDPAVCSARA